MTLIFAAAHLILLAAQLWLAIATDRQRRAYACHHIRLHLTATGLVLTGFRDTCGACQQVMHRYDTI